MLTVCPKCTQALAVTANDLRIGQGFVRCGRCATAFNALLALSDESLETATPAAAAPERAPPETAAPEAEPETPAPQPDSPVTVADVVESQGNETIETIILEGDGFLQTEEFVDIDTINRELTDAALGGAAARVTEVERTDEVEIELPPLTGTASAATPQPIDQSQPASADTAHDVPPETPPPHWLQEPAASAAPASGDECETLDNLQPAAAASRQHLWPGLLWRAATATLALLLVAQLLHHQRNNLAVNPTWYQLLRGPYQAAGMPLYPNWNLQSYDLQQLGGADSLAANTNFLVQFGLGNKSTTRLPFPLIRLKLYNRYSKRVAIRDLAVNEYLPATLHTSEFIAAGQRYSTEIGIANPGNEYASFELDVCLPTAGGVRCAADISPSGSTRS